MDIVPVGASQDGEGHQDGDNQGRGFKKKVRQGAALDLPLRSCEEIVEGLKDKKKKQ